MALSLVFCLLSIATISTTTCIPVAKSDLFQQSPRSINTITRETDEKSRTFHSIRAELVHKDHPLRAPPGNLNLTPKERAERDFHSSMRRAAVLLSRHERWLAGSLPTYVANISTNANEAEYLITISLGTPAQNFVAIADTGSDLTWLQCLPCDHCYPQQDSFFDPSRSSSYTSLSCSDTACQKFTSQYPPDWDSNCQTISSSSNCNYFYAYGDGSNTTGDFSSDVIHLQSIDGHITDIPNYAFGCSHSTFSDSGILPGTVDGLVGLGQGDISFPSQLGSKFGNIFSYCLVSPKGVTTQTSLLLFGEAALSNVTGIQYTPTLYNNTLYFVGLEGISVGGQQLGISSSLFANNGSDGGTIFDSGTTYTQMQPQALDVLANFLTSNLSGTFTQIVSPLNGLDYCWDVSGSSDSEIAKRVPTITLRFTNADYDLPYENAFLGDDIPFKFTCLAIGRGGVLSTQTIIGNYQQRNVYIIYDRANHQIGWVPRDCGNAVSLSSAASTAASSPSSATSCRSSLESVMTFVLLLPVIALITAHGVQ